MWKWTFPVKGALDSNCTCDVVTEVINILTLAWSLFSESYEIAVTTGAFEYETWLGKTYVIGPDELVKILK